MNDVISVWRELVAYGRSRPRETRIISSVISDVEKLEKCNLNCKRRDTCSHITTVTRHGHRTSNVRLKRIEEKTTLIFHETMDLFNGYCKLRESIKNIFCIKVTTGFTLYQHSTTSNVTCASPVFKNLCNFQI